MIFGEIQAGIYAWFQALPVFSPCVTSSGKPLNHPTKKHPLLQNKYIQVP
jgi:hypothetical protein